MRPHLMHLAKIRITQIASQAINSAINERIAQNKDYENLIQWKLDSQNKIAGFMLNYSEHMKITSETKEVVQDTLRNLTKFPEHIPLGMALDSAIIASFGPDIPIRFVPAGAAIIDLHTRNQDAGINMLLVEVYIRVRVEVTIVVPFDTETEIVETEVPVSYLLVKGDVPLYYFDNKGRPIGGADGSVSMPPNIALPAPSSEASPNSED